MLFESKRMRWKERVFDLGHFWFKTSRQETACQASPYVCVWKSNFEMVLKERGSEGVDWQDEYKGRTLFGAIIQLKFP